MSGTRVYVGGLAHDVRERDLERFFKGYGRTRDFFIKNGYGFVEFDDKRDADDAIYELNGKDLLGRKVSVEAARGKARGSGSDRYDGGRGGDRGGRGGDRGGERSGARFGPITRTKYRLLVENLSSTVSWQDLKDFMRQAGEVTFADAHKQRRNEGIVEFASRSDLKTAIDKFDDTELKGRRIRLVEDSGDAGGSGGRGGGGRGRSRSFQSRSRSPRRSRSRSRSRSPSRGRARSVSRSRSRSPRRDSSPKPRHQPSRSARRDSRSRSRSARQDSRSHSRSRSPPQ